MNYYMILAIVAAGLAIWAMVDLSYNSLKPQKKIFWFMIVILIPLIGPVLYYTLHRKD